MRLFELDVHENFDVPWSGERTQRIHVDGKVYKYCHKEDHWVEERCFGSDRSREDNLDYWCRNCRRAYQALMRRLQPFKIPFLIKQGYRCAICEKDMSGVNTRNVAIDHCHKTEEPRGVLCHHCNSGIGYLKDNPQFLERALQYLAGEISYA